MTQKETRGTGAVEKGLELFLALIDNADALPLSILAQRAGIPLSTAHRIVAAYMRSGLLSRLGHGRYTAGLRLASLARHGDEKSILTAASRDKLQQLAREFGATVHLGLLEGEMVTYIVKEHGGGKEILTRETQQLEGYCSAIGKVLLAHLDQASQETYLANGPFVPLTTNTIIDPTKLREEFQKILIQGYAFDNAEISNNLYCLSTHVQDRFGKTHCAISVSFHSNEPVSLDYLPALQNCARIIGQRLG